MTQILAVNVALVTAAMFAASVAARLDLAAALERRSFEMLVLAVATTLLVNAVVLRRRFEPLEELIETMEAVDLSHPGRRAELSESDSREVSRLGLAFNRMLERVESERRNGASAVLRAQEAERQRIAQDLHDEVNQALTAIVLRLEASGQGAPAPLGRELCETKRLAVQAMEELLHLARELRPTALDDHGLLPALQTQVADFRERTGIAATFVRHGEIPPLTPEQQLVIYRVTQESLSNVVQHAGASRVAVELSFVGRSLLRVSDDGVGVGDSATGALRSGGLGVSGMRERALLVGGRLEVSGKPGEGTTVTLTL